ncbi:MAG TPA: hypothetical protein VM582_00580 [Candidatus Thermoplasmatota archaeon]|nr:hypothetical protein [Candidatus Thermoplasmatota archaeon]
MTARALLALLLLVVPAAAALVEPPAPAQDATIQPGDRLRSFSVACTAGFVFDGLGARAGRVYVSSAAHCFSTLGQLVSSDAQANFGVLVHLGDGRHVEQDYALIEVRPEFHHLVRGAVRGHPGIPRDVARAGTTAPLDEVQVSGHGAGFELTAATREGRRALLASHDATTQRLVGPLLSGDSGGPLVHLPSGDALGLVSRIRVPCECTQLGPTIEHVMEQAAAQGYPLALRRA